MRIVKLIYPSKDKIIISSLRFSEVYDIYAAIEEFKKNLPDVKLIQEVDKIILLKGIINLHNDTGIQSIDRIKSMIKSIKQGKEILSSEEKIPNIKLVKTKDNKHVLFDGHHTMLAYMHCGKQYLHEIPHIIIEDERGFTTDEEMKVFFGEHDNKSNWKEHTINWQAEKEEQLCKRIHKNMGEVIHSVSKALQ